MFEQQYCQVLCMRQIIHCDLYAIQMDFLEQGVFYLYEQYEEALLQAGMIHKS